MGDAAAGPPVSFHFCRVLDGFHLSSFPGERAIDAGHLRASADELRHRASSGSAQTRHDLDFCMQREDFHVPVGRSGGGIFVRIFQVEGFIPPGVVHEYCGLGSALAGGSVSLTIVYLCWRTCPAVIAAMYSSGWLVRVSSGVRPCWIMSDSMLTDSSRLLKTADVGRWVPSGSAKS